MGGCFVPHFDVEAENGMRVFGADVVFGCRPEEVELPVEHVGGAVVVGDEEVRIAGKRVDFEGVVRACVVVGEEVKGAG